MNEAELSAVIESAREKARFAVADAANQVKQAEAALKFARDLRAYVVQTASAVLGTKEIAELVGLGQSTVSNLIADKVEVVDGRTGEAVTGPRAEVAELRLTMDAGE